MMKYSSLLVLLFFSNASYSQLNISFGEYKSYENALHSTIISLNPRMEYSIQYETRSERSSSYYQNDILFEGKYEMRDTTIVLYDSLNAIVGYIREVPQEYLIKFDFSDRMSRENKIKILNAGTLLARTKKLRNNGTTIEEGDWIYDHHFGYFKEGIWTYYNDRDEEVNSVLFYHGDLVKDPYTWSLEKGTNRSPFSTPKKKI